VNICQRQTPFLISWNENNIIFRKFIGVASTETVI
jgi:hypothetical protein